VEQGYELPRLVLEYRSIAKLKNTYVEALPELIDPQTGLIHTSFNQNIAVTGRLSSNNPNLQNIPIRTERGRQVRKAFIPRDEAHTLLASDYSQIELRIMADMSGDEHMIEAFRNGADIHRITAAKVFRVEPEAVTSEQRRRAKTVNFGMIYGITPFGLSERLGISRSEAKQIHDNFFQEFPAIRTFMDACIEKARTHGYAETLKGRRHYLPDIDASNANTRGYAERNAINTPIQGTAADMIKRAMIDMQAALREQGFRAKMMLQVHDELLFDVPHKEVEALKPVVARCMEQALPLKRVPIETEIGTGPNWLEAH
jgi:DNA polymerase-1